MKIPSEKSAARTRGIRWGLTIVLLIEVWMNAHWSVALSLTLVFIYFELHTLAQGIVMSQKQLDDFLDKK